MKFGAILSVFFIYQWIGENQKDSHQLEAYLNSFPVKDTVTFLDLSGYEITCIPNVLWEFKALKTIDLSNYKSETLPNEIGELSDLEIFICRNSMLVELPCGILHLKKLKSIIMSDNRLIRLPHGISKLKHLASIKIPWSTDLREIPEDIIECESLRTFQFCEEKLTERSRLLIQKLKFPEKKGKIHRDIIGEFCN